MTNLNDTLLQPSSSFPVFKPNQVLSADDLNLLLDYLHGQTRWTRLGLIGVGPVCGLVPRWNKTDNRLDVSAGYGVTSHGYLIHLGRSKRTHYKKTELDVNELFGGEEDKKYPAFELVEKPDDARKPDDEIKELDQAFAVAKVVLVLLKREDAATNDESCQVDCDETSGHRSFKVVTLLIEQTDADQLLAKSYQSDISDDWPVEQLLAGKYTLKDLYLERFGYPFQEPVHTKAKTYDEFTELYTTVIERGMKRILPTLKEAHRMFSPLFTRIHALPLLPAAVPKDSDRLDEEGFKKRFTVDKSNRLFLQYLYDHLLDLILAHDELREAAFDLMDACNTNAHVFPRHLLLGKPLEDSAELPIPPSVYRTPLAQPPVYNGNGSRLGTAALLFKRLELLLDHYAVPGNFSQVREPDTDLRVTPSRWGSASLSERAIPYYYSSQEDLRAAWNGNRHRSGRDRRTLGYHFQRPEPIPDAKEPDVPYAEDPLVFDFEAHDFFRIEGHIGMEKTHALQKVIKLRERYNLPFDIVLLKLGGETGASDLKDCEIAIFQTQYTKLRTDLMCALKEADLSEDKDVKPLMAKLDTWDKLDDFVYTDNFEIAFKTAAESHGSGDCLLGSDKTAFRELHQLYTERREAIEGQELFHEFARKHPGIEHKAGVPRGGTFILVYQNPGALVDEPDLAEKRLNELAGETAKAVLQDRVQLGLQQVGLKQKPEVVRDLVAQKEEQFRLPPDVEKAIGESVNAAIMAEIKQARSIVIGDFCLPYLCCSNCPPNAYVFVRPRPLLLLVPVLFCKSDENEYPFVIDPVGGALTSDSGGIEQKGERFVFVPAATTIPEGRVQVTYSVDGVESMLLLQILPEADAGFRGLKGPYCSKDKPVELTPNSRIVESRFEGNGVVGRHFDPGEVKFGKDEDPRIVVNVTHWVIDETTGCQKSETLSATVYRAPDAEFSGLDEGGSYCRDGEAQRLEPMQPDGAFTMDPPQQGVIVVDNKKQVFFNLQSIVFPEGQDRLAIQVTHSISREFDGKTCEAKSTRQITVFAGPQATFESIPENICLQQGPDDASDSHLIRLVPEQGTARGGEFMTEIDGNISKEGILDDCDCTYFDPKPDSVPRDTPIKIIYSVQDEHGCSGSADQTTQVHDASFSGLKESYCSDAEAPKLTPQFSDRNVVDTRFEYVVNGAPADSFDPAKVPFDEGQDTAVVEVTLVVIRKFGEETCEARLTRQTLVHRIKPATFRPIAGHFCQKSDTKGQRLPLIPHEGMPDGRFMTSADAGIVYDEDDAFFDPWAEGVPLNTEIKIRYEVQEKDCFRSSTQTTRVLNAEFTGLRGTYRKGDDAAILEPRYGKGVTSQFFVDDELIPGHEPDLGSTHIPPERDSVEVTVTHRVTLRDQNNDSEWSCESDPQTTVIANRPTVPEVPTDPTGPDGGGTIDGEIVSSPSGSGNPENLAVTAPSPEDRGVADLLLSRGARNLASIGRIAEENSGISRTRTFERVEALLGTSFDRPAEDLIADYEGLIPTLLSAHSRAQPDRKIAYEALAQTATLGFFDRIANQTLTDEARDRAKAQLAKLEDAGIGLQKLYESAWLAEELEGGLNSEQIERVRSLIE